MISVIVLVVHVCQHSWRQLTPVIGKPTTRITPSPSLLGNPAQKLRRAARHHAKSSSPSTAERWSKNGAANTGQIN
jgi:hypothetical protein